MTGQLLHTANMLTGDQFPRPVLAGFRSMHLTLVYLLGASDLWFNG
ncbi:MAG: hypothetical protein KDI03_17715 [Anaerolineae bacterium]|nr:hypothetical protein [Anaerolineae bacterium]